MSLTSTNQAIVGYFGRVLAIGLMTLLAACGGGAGSGGTATLQLIEVTATPPQAAAGTTGQLAAAAMYSDGTHEDVTGRATRSSSNTGVATIGAGGSVSARTAGSTTISATLPGMTGAVNFTVTPAVLVSIGVTPPNLTLARGTTAQLTATGLYSDQSTQDLTHQVNWSSSSSAVASIANIAGALGLVSAVGTGSSMISATRANVSGTCSITVSAAVLQSIAVTPAHPTLAIGSAQRFFATGTYTDGSTQNLSTQVIWESQTPSVATISNAAPTQGLASAASAGGATITAMIAGVSGGTNLTVSQGVSPIALGVFPGNDNGNPLWDLNRTALTKDETQANHKMAFVETFADWQDPNGYYAAFGSIEPALNAYANAGYDMVLSWSALNGSNAGDSTYTLAALINGSNGHGSHDDYITQFAKDAAAWGKTIYLRPFHEMNGNWYPWGFGVNSNTTAQFKQLWIHVYTIFQQQNAKNVKFIWCPNVGGLSWQTNPTTSLADYYPGDAYVDWMALDGYNSFGAPWWQFSSIFSSSYAELVAINPSKPIMVAEAASEFSPPDGDKAAWITNMETDIPTMFPNIHALSWFDDNGYAAPGYPPNLYRFDSDAGSQAAFQHLASDPKWQGAGLGVW